jgi:hypothetical protein
MSLPVYSTTFYEQHDLDGDGPNLEPPAGVVWVIKGIDVVYQGGPASVFAITSANVTLWANSFSTPLAFQYASYRGGYVIEPSTFIFMRAAAGMDVTVWGYTLTLP